MTQSGPPVASSGNAPSPSGTTASAGGLGQSERLKIVRDSLINYAGPFVSAILGLLAIPVLLKALGFHAYGLWVAVVALVATVSAIDLGVGSALIRMVAGAESEAERDAIAPLVVGTWKVYAWIALGGAAVIALVGATTVRLSILTPAERQAALAAWGAGIVLYVGQVALTRSNFIFEGLRRFDLTNTMSILLGVLRVGGSVPLALAGAGLPGVAAWQAASTVLVALTATVMVGRTDPRFRLRRMKLPWESLRAHVGFGLTSQAAQLAMVFVSDSALPLFVGAMLGPAAIVPLNIAQKFPAAVGQLTTASAQVFYSAAAAHAASRERLRGFLALGMRWMAVLALGPCAILWILAPALLEVWIGMATPTTITIFRLMVLTVLFVALGEGGLNATWGTGNAGGVLRVFALCGAPVTLLAFPLMHWMGVAGASWALLLSSAAMTVAFTRLACRANGLESLRLARDAFRGLFWPLVATIVCTVGLTSLLRPGGWVAIVTVGLAGELVYLAVALWHGFDEDEIALVRGLVGRVARVPRERIEHS